MSRFSTIFLALLFILFSGSLLSAQTAAFDTVSIHDLQYVADPASDDLSAFNGDTVVVRGLVMNGPRDLWVGARWAVYIVDPDSFPNPWSGFFIIQHDTTQIATNFGFLEPGMECYFTGVVDEFGSFSQLVTYGLFYFPDPVIPINIVNTNVPLPAPVELSLSDLATIASGEKWESMPVKINDATVVNNNISGDWASITDESGSTGYLGEYFNWFRDRLMAGTYNWPSNGTNIDVVGFTRDESGSPGRVYTINPRDTTDITIKSNPPVITEVTRNPGLPKPGNPVTVSAAITDDNAVAEALVHYSFNGEPFKTLTMSEAVADTFRATIRSGSEGDYVRYFVTAEDGAGDGTIVPGDTSMANGSVFSYVVRDGNLMIADIQDTRGYALDISAYDGYEVTVEGVVMTDSTDEAGDFWIQEAADKWSGIWVAEAQTFQKGDRVQVTGTVEENFSVTRIDDVTDVSLVQAGAGTFDPVVVTTGELNNDGENNEAYESVLVEVQNVTVTVPFPDAPSNFGEFTIDDGSGGVRVDDFFDGFGGQTSDTTYYEGLEIASMVAFQYYSFDNYKLVPRDSNDVDIATSIEREDIQPSAFVLEQNYPNPFNPTTTIRYSIPVQEHVTLAVYDALGRRIATLVDGIQSAGTYRVTLNGEKLSSGIYFYSVQSGQFSDIKKMVLIK